MNPYLSLLRTNRNFRLLFLGQAISQLGDWFNSVAVFGLLLDLLEGLNYVWRRPHVRALMFVKTGWGLAGGVLRRTIGPAYFIVGIGYMALAAAPTLPLAALSVLAAHFGGSILWVFSTARPLSETLAAPSGEEEVLEDRIR